MGSDAQITPGFGNLVRGRGDERMVHEATLHIGRTVRAAHEAAEAQVAGPPNAMRLALQR